MSTLPRITGIKVEVETALEIELNYKLKFRTKKYLIKVKGVLYMAKPMITKSQVAVLLRTFHKSFFQYEFKFIAFIPGLES